MSNSLRRSIIAELASTDRALFDPAYWHSFQGADWKRTLPWLDVSGLALYFWQKLKTINSESALPSFVQTRLARCYEENCSRVSAIRKESESLNNLFERAGVKYALVKGFALTPDYCPDPALRTQYDHDYLIRPDTLARAEDALQKAGYTPKLSREENHIAYLAPTTGSIPSEPPTGLYSAGLGRPIELHVSLWDSTEEKFEAGVSEDLLDRARRFSWQSFEYWALSDEDTLIFQVLHAFRHILRNWCRLSVFLEISYFLRQRTSDSDFWARYCGRVENLRWMPEAGAVVFGLAGSLFGASVPLVVKDLVRPGFTPVIDLWIERYGFRAALSNFRKNKHSLFLHREFVDDPSAWKEVRRRRLFPIRRPHRLPNVLCRRGSRGLRKRWSQWAHVLLRFQFHLFSALAYAWEYRRWQLIRGRRAMVCSKPAGA